MPQCVICQRACSGTLSNFRDRKTGTDIKSEIHKYDWEDLIYESPVCINHYELTNDDVAWLMGTGRYAQ